MKLVLLGTTGYHPNDRRQTACMALPECGVVLDAGTGMYRLGPWLKTDTLDIFLSHAHLDHVVGLTYLLELLYGRDMRRVTIHGEQEKLAAVQEHLFSPLIFPVSPDYEFRPLTGETALPQSGRLTSFPLEHPGGALGFRLDWPGRSLAYVTDTTAKPDCQYLDAIHGVDVLLHECYFSDEQAQFAEITGHSCATPVAEVARAAEVGRLILVHVAPFSTDDDPIGLARAQEVFPQTELAEDGLEIEF